MKYYVDGGRRNNGYPGAYGAAAAVENQGEPNETSHTLRLPESGNGNPKPTNQRAELTAVIIALRRALDSIRSQMYDRMDSRVVHQWLDQRGRRSGGEHKPGQRSIRIGRSAERFP